MSRSAGPGQRWCPKCKETKPDSGFKCSKGNWYNVCKECDYQFRRKVYAAGRRALSGDEPPDYTGIADRLVGATAAEIKEALHNAWCEGAGE